MGGISIVGGGEEVTTEEEIDREDKVGKVEPLGSRVYSESHSSACSVGKRRQEVHPGVVAFDRRVAGKEGQEDRVAVDVKEGEFMMYNKWVCE